MWQTLLLSHFLGSVLLLLCCCCPILLLLLLLLVGFHYVAQAGFSFINFKFITQCVFMCFCVGQKTSCESWFSPSEEPGVTLSLSPFLAEPFASPWPGLELPKFCLHLLSLGITDMVAPLIPAFGKWRQMDLRPAWYSNSRPRQGRLHSETLSKEKQKERKRERNMVVPVARQSFFKS